MHILIIYLLGRLLLFYSIPVEAPLFCSSLLSHFHHAPAQLFLLHCALLWDIACPFYLKWKSPNSCPYLGQNKSVKNLGSKACMVLLIQRKKMPVEMLYSLFFFFPFLFKKQVHKALLLECSKDKQKVDFILLFPDRTD